MLAGAASAAALAEERVYVAPGAPVYVEPAPAPAPPVYEQPPVVVRPEPTVIIGWHGDRYWDGSRWWEREEWRRHRWHEEHEEHHGLRDRD
ncbi:hypothetical protein BKK80_34145 [Cupriavidus malaysiensis]|uniref:Uncharacterized protein n=1 Tax=Cupriavidus malaysiensis TaxID=367825 RepID=A0ABN4TW07_9BURK|nr:hypothetical protein BKK80_34145 [Cupriavidus malaysiensis]